MLEAMQRCTEDTPPPTPLAERRSCTDMMRMMRAVTPITNVAGEIRTIEGLATVSNDGLRVLHPVQQAFLQNQVPQCGWCMSGQMMAAAAFLEQNPTPSEAEIVDAMNQVYCRCGCYHRIKGAVAKAAEQMASGEGTAV
jgi:isoquinoline 1-oxidoreductase alpha subunit